VGNPSERADAASAETAVVDVLVVENDLAVRESEAAVLRQASYSVVEAEDSLSALACLTGIEFGAVVLDLYLPGLGGLWLLDELDDPPPVVLVTARELDYEVMRRRDKFLVYLKKPVPPSALLSAVARAATLSRGT
jgi:two-component system, NtrC family, phosphoglycerate transport system response regulator PgtA